MQTIDCVRQCEPEHANVSIFYPYPGTDLFDSAKSRGLVKNDIVNPKLERTRAMLDLPGFSRRQIQKEYILFPYRAFKGKKSTADIAARVLRAYIITRPMMDRFYRGVIRHPIMRKVQSKMFRMSK
jgi:hypothetical protein